MTPLARRLVILADEWLGILLLLYLRHDRDPLFWPVLVIWAVAVYGVSYPHHWVDLWKRRSK